MAEEVGPEEKYAIGSAPQKMKLEPSQIATKLPNDKVVKNLKICLSCSNCPIDIGISIE